MSLSDNVRILELKSLDLRFALRGSRNLDDSPVVIVSLDERTIDKYGWPVNRALYAEVIWVAAKGGAEAIGVDTWFSHPWAGGDNTNADTLLAQSLKFAGNVFLAAGIEPINRKQNVGPTQNQYTLTRTPFPKLVESAFLPSWVPYAKEIVPPFSQLASAAKGLASVTVIPDRDGVVRRTPLVVDVGGVAFPNLALALAAQYLGEETRLQPGPSMEFILEVPGSSDIRIPVDDSGQILVNYPGKTALHPRYSFLDVIEMHTSHDGDQILEAARNAFQGKVVIIGSEAEGGMDLVSTPYSVLYAGHWVWADLVENILSRSFIITPGIWAAIVVCLAMGILTGLAMIQWKLVHALSFCASLVLGHLLVCYFAFSHLGLWLETVGPVAGVFAGIIVLLPLRHLLETRSLLSDVIAMQDYNEVMMDSMSNGLLAIDPMGKITKMNQAAVRIFETPEGVDQNTDAILSCCPPLQNILRESLRNHEPSPIVEIAFDRDGKSRRWIDITANPIRDQEGRFLGLICFVQDVTEMKRLRESERLKERLSILGEMSAHLAHEVGNSAQAISTYFGNIKEELNLGNGRRETILGRAVRGLEAEIISIGGWAYDLKEYSRPIRCTKENVDLQALLRDAVEASFPKGCRKDLEVNVHVSEGLELASVDRRLLASTLINLIRNAEDAMPERGTIRIRCRGASSEGSLVIEVEDTGSGIQEDYVKKIFEPFFSTKEEGGTGLGLAIARKNVELQNGTLTFETRHGIGTVFRIEIPAE